jgi:hypothetical protein
MAGEADRPGAAADTQAEAGQSVSQKPDCDLAIGQAAAMRRHEPVARYLRGLASACLEAARRPELLGVVIGLLRLAPQTLVVLEAGEVAGELKK